MQPLLRAGMIVTLAPLGEGGRVGDVVVFARAGKFVAHRIVRRHSETYVTCGDARPHMPERVLASEIVGRVVAIHDSRDAGRRVDDGRYALAAWLLRRTRIPRGLALRARGRIGALVAPARTALSEPPAFRAMLLAAKAFLAGDLRAGTSTLTSVPIDDLVGCLRRHHLTGFASLWLSQARAAGIAVPGALSERLDRVRVSNALQAEYVERTMHDVARVLQSASIVPIFLKGSARLALGSPNADAHFSCDVDVLVPRERIAAAAAALRASGYVDRETDRMRAFLRRYEQHIEALYPPFRGAPVELHVALVAPGYVSNALDYNALANRTVVASGVLVLDRVASAVHLLYHGRNFRNLRDVVLLAHALRAFDARERIAFEAIVDAERDDGRRVRAVRWLAEAFVGRQGRAPAYARFALAREDLPFQLRRRDGLLDAWFARQVPPYRGLFEVRRRWLVWLANVAWTPSVATALQTLNRQRDDVTLDLYRQERLTPLR